MNDTRTELAHPRGSYGVDGDYRLVPAPVVAAGYGLLCLAPAAVAVTRLRAGAAGRALFAGAFSLLLVGNGAGVLRFSRRGKFEVWARLLTELRLRGEERVLDLGCGRGAVLLAAAKLLPAGHAVGIDLWRADQTGNSPEATLRNADVEGVADRVEVRTGDMTELPFADSSFDVIVSSLAIHNIPGARRLVAVDEAVRVLRPGGRVVLADLGFTRRYAARLRALGMTDVRRRNLGWRAWWGGPWARTHVVTATKVS